MDTKTATPSVGEKIAARCPNNLPVDRRALASLIDAAIRDSQKELVSVIKWALGEGDSFPERLAHEGAYWWRKELRKLFNAALAKAHSGQGDV